MILLSIDLKFKRIDCQLIRHSIVIWLSIIDLGVKRFEVQAGDLRFK